ncbi:MAG: 3-oxoacyl-[acyl-carrier-protein] synthase III C-terminal domain-containing protein [Leptospirales bacterium]
MRIKSIAAEIPSRKVTNQDILDVIEEHSPEVTKLTLKSYQRLVRVLLKKAGAETRYFRDLDKGEKAVDFIQRAIQKAIDQSGVKKEDIDLVIYCGVGKGFIEPANAYFYAKMFDLKASCFDICDACMSWIRALEIAHQFLQTGRYKNIMIVNGEFNAYEHGYPELFKIKDLKQIKYTFPTYTIGEAATATIVGQSDAKWTFDYISRPEYADLCTIPLDAYADFVPHSDRLGLTGPGNFLSFGHEMIEHATVYLQQLVKDVIKDYSVPDIYFPHAATSTAYLLGGVDLGIDREKMYTEVFPTYGNLVSASVPVGINHAIEGGRLNRGDKVVLFPASAGMVYAVVQFEY